MNYASIRTCDIANGEGVRVTLFVSGCTHRCKGCFNPDQWDFGYGEPFTREVEDRILKELEPSFISGLTILGGEPMEPANQRALVPFLRRIESFRVGLGSDRVGLGLDRVRLGSDRVRLGSDRAETVVDDGLQADPRKTLTDPRETLTDSKDPLIDPKETLIGPKETLTDSKKTLTGARKTLWVYTGCLLEELKDPASRWHTEVTDEFLSYIDVLVDGPFVEELKDISLQFRGSSNQRILRLK